MPALDRVDTALAWARDRLAAAPDAEPLDAPLLLAHVLGVERAALIAHPERALSLSQLDIFHALVQQRVAGMPMAYLVGSRAFYDREFYVTPDVLIPRPETEHLVEAALAWGRGRDGLRVVDVGTGSGAIAVILAAHLPGARVLAIDISPEAVSVARHNAARYDLGERLAAIRGDLLAPLLAVGETVDLIAANLPYIATEELAGLPVMRCEPRLALDGGPDGLALIRRLLRQLPAALAPGGLALLEIGAGQGAAVRSLAQAALPGADVRVRRDYAGHERVVSIERGA